MSGASYFTNIVLINFMENIITKQNIYKIEMIIRIMSNSGKILLNSPGIVD
jgi:hypothetical protein